LYTHEHFKIGDTLLPPPPLPPSYRFFILILTFYIQTDYRLLQHLFSVKRAVGVFTATCTLRKFMLQSCV